MNIRDDALLLLDGAMGTMLQRGGMKPGELSEILNLTKPDLIQSIHRAYIDAGSQVIYANTFGANRKKLRNAGHSVTEVIGAAFRNARQAAAGTDAKIGLDVGPIGELLAPMGTLSFEEAYDIFAEMMDKGLLRRDDPAMLAFAYTAPISALIHLCDREPERTDEAMAQVEAFSRYFIQVHGVQNHV